MKHFVKVTLPCLAMAFGLSACENAADINRKPAVAETLVKDSLEKCAVNDSDAAYASRLRSGLMRVQTNRLDVFANNKTTICLDARIDNQALGTWDSKIFGVYNAKENVVSLPDNMRAQDDNAKALVQLGYNLSHGKNASADFSYAGSFFCGRACTNSIQWRNEGVFDKDSIAKNPQLKTPPLKSVAGKR